MRMMTMVPSVLLLVVLCSPFVSCQKHFTESASSLGINYHRTPSPGFYTREIPFRESSINISRTLFNMFDMAEFAVHGMAGVAILDYDNDGDEDIYVTNGFESVNSLYQNQLIPTGTFSFIDVGESSGTGMLGHDSTAVCCADYDNDGDTDCLVGARGQPDILLVNKGDGTFRQDTSTPISQASYSTFGCSWGDLNGDGWLDVAVISGMNFSAPYSFTDKELIFGNTQPDTIFLSNRHRGFIDFTEESNFNYRDHPFLPGPLLRNVNTYSLTLVDVDGDGDLDAITGDNHAPALIEEIGQPRPSGYLMLHLNNGKGVFTQKVPISTTAGGWWGQDFGDFNCDGYVDAFGTNGGDGAGSLIVNTFTRQHTPMGYFASRWMSGGPSGFTDSFASGDLLSDVGTLPFGGGTVVLDYDNDGDQDIFFAGAEAMAFFVWADNPGIMLENKGTCSGSFTPHPPTSHVEDELLAVTTTDYKRLNVQGVSTGDLNNDGYADIVTASNVRWLPPPAILAPAPVSDGSRWDPYLFGPVFRPTGQVTFPYGFPTPTFVWSQVHPPRGPMTVEINDGGDAHWGKVSLLGGYKLTPKGKINRDGVGSTVAFIPHGSQTRAMKPIIAGSSFLSSVSKIVTFGMGQAEAGDLEVKWLEGTWNKLYDVAHGEHIRFPEIPCSYKADWAKKKKYTQCVALAVLHYRLRGYIDESLGNRIVSSADRAYDEYHVNDEASSSDSSNTFLYLGGGGGALALVGLAGFGVAVHKKKLNFWEMWKSHDEDGMAPAQTEMSEVGETGAEVETV